MSVAFQEPSNIEQYVREHLFRQFTGKCVLLARMIRDKQSRQISGQFITRSVPKRKRSVAWNLAAVFQQREKGAHGDAAERENGARANQIEFALEIRPAICQ